MKDKLLIIIFLIALFFRIYKLGVFPYGFHVDEVKVGWNALSILKTGRDDRQNKFALYYNSFGDFRPTGIFYITIPSIAFLGRNEFAVRFPSALFGALTVFPLYLFVKELKDKKEKNKILSIENISSFLLAVSPWHISTSRATSEVVISMFLALFGLYFFVKSLNKMNIKHCFFSALFILVSYLFYHSIRLLAPVFVLGIIFFYFNKIRKTRLLKKISLITLFLIGFTTFFLALNKESRGRFSQVSIFNDLDVSYELSRMPFEEGPGRVFIARFFHNKPLVYTRKFINEFAKYFSADFFLNPESAKPERYTTTGLGVLTYIELALLILGITSILQKKSPSLPLILLLIAPLPSAITTEDSPNLHRSLYMIPFIAITCSYGFEFLVSISKKYKRQITFLTIFFLLSNFIFYLHMYYVHNKVHKPLYRNIGAKELALKINEIQKDYEKIIITNIPDDPYPWIAFFTNRDPSQFNQDAVKRSEGVWTTENFVFTGQRCPSRDAFEKPDVKKLLVVDAEGCATESKLKDSENITLTKIYRPDETEVYNLWSMK